MKEKPIEVITPPNMLKAKVGGKLASFDKAAIARAEAALQNLSSEFDTWMDDELKALEASFAQLQADGVMGPAGDAFYKAAHELKGLGTTYSFPLVTRLMGATCKLFELHEDDRSKVKMALIGAFVQATQAAVRDGIRTDEHPVGRALAEELERQVLATAA